MSTEVKSNNQDLILGREESYDATTQNCWSFKRVDDVVNGQLLNLCNMAGDYPFEVAGKLYKDSERLYLCGEFSNNTPDHLEIQKELLASRSGYAAKRFVKGKHKKQIRADFPTFRLQWMLYVVWQKCLGNANFRRVLLAVPDDAILIEDTTTDPHASASIWGCQNKELNKTRKEYAKRLAEANKHLSKIKLQQLINTETNKITSIGSFTGENNIGKILMICRRCLKEGSEPQIDYELLRQSNIYIQGELLF